MAEKLKVAKKKKIYCDICKEKITTKNFKVVWVFDTNKEDKFYHESMSGVEKEIVTCNVCIEYLNFKEVKI